MADEEAEPTVDDVDEDRGPCEGLGADAAWLDEDMMVRRPGQAPYWSGL